MENKKVIFSAFITVLTLAAGALYIPVSRAATNIPPSGTTSMLGVSRLMGNAGGANSAMMLADFSDAPTTNQNYTLPAISGKQGQIVIVKAVEGEYGAFLNIYPASGDELDSDASLEYYQVPAWVDATAVIFMADPTNNTWWIISNA